jgi:hypothetical protein
MWWREKSSAKGCFLVRQRSSGLAGGYLLTGSGVHQTLEVLNSYIKNSIGERACTAEYTYCGAEAAYF